jgi:hypothetical protein
MSKLLRWSDTVFAGWMRRMEALHPRRRLQYVVAGALVLIALLGILYTRTTGVDVDRQNRVMYDLHELQQLDAEWDANLLRAHIGSGLADARLVAPVTQMRELMERLEEALPMTRGRGARQAHTALAGALRMKTDLVTEFRTLNTPLRTALQTLPPALADLKTELGGIEGALAPGPVVVRLDALLNDVLADTLRYNLVPAPALASRIEGNLAQVEAQKGRFSLAVSEQMDAIARDARIIMANRPAENEVEARIAALGTGEAMARLSGRGARAPALPRLPVRLFDPAAGHACLCGLAPAPQLPHHQ